MLVVSALALTFGLFILNAFKYSLLLPARSVNAFLNVFSYQVRGK